MAQRTFNDNDPLTSLDILDAAGSYDLSNLSVFNWTIGRFGNAAAAYNYESMTINVVPTPGIIPLTGLAALNIVRRRTIRL